MIQISIQNTSTLVSAADLAKWVPALQVQISRDFAKTWGIDATLVIGPPTEAGAYRLILKDESDAPGDLGYHWLASGVPESRIFCRDTLNDGDTISGVISHELVEMLVDPKANKMEGSYILECADPVQSTGYMIDEVYVSNFVLPAYFRANESGLTTGFDFRGLLTTACPAILPGSYIEWWTGDHWQQTFARRADGSIPYQMLKPGGRSAFRASMGAPTP